MKYLYTLLLVLFFTGCVSITKQYDTKEKYRLMSVSLEPESKLMFKKHYKGNTWCEITSSLLYNSSLIGSVSRKTPDSFEFTVEKIRYFGNWPNGWTDGTSEAYGKLLFTKVENGYQCKVIDKFELWEVVKGEIRYLESYYRDENGIQKVKARLGRMVEVVKFMKTFEGPDFYGHYRYPSTYGEPFMDVVQKKLFPETRNFYYLKDTGQFPAVYYEDVTSDQSSDIVDDKQFFHGFGYLWNVLFTKKVFPEILWEPRDSGSLFRDFEEAPQILFMLYNIDYYFNTVLPGSTFSENPFFKSGF